MQEAKVFQAGGYMVITFLAGLMGIHYFGIVRPEILTPNPVLDLLAPLSFDNHYGIRIGFILATIIVSLTSPSSEMVGDEVAKDQKKKTLMFGIFLGALFILLVINVLPWLMFAVLYPIAFLAFLITSFIVANILKRKKKSFDVNFGFQNAQMIVDNPYSFHWKGKDGYINIENIFRSVGILGSAGAGKSFTLIEPMILQAIQKGFAALIFDFKMAQNFSPEEKDWALTRFAYMCFLLHSRNQAVRDENGKWIGEHSIHNDRRNFYIINFKDIRYSHRVNPIHPDYLKSQAYANEAAMTLLTNLNPKWIKDRDFWADAAIIYLRSIIWFLRCEFPTHCTIPHAIAIALMDHNMVTAMLALNDECFETMASLMVAIKQNAEGQIAGMVSSLQTPITRLSSPEIAWGLSSNDFSLALNDPENPAILGLGSDPELQETYSPICSLIASVCRKVMNQPNRLPSLYLLDEAPQLYIPKLADLPATARSNKLAVIVCGQDLSQFEVMFGKDVATSLLANLGNAFFGQINDLNSAKMVSEIIGTRDKENMSTNTGKSYGESLGKSSGESFSLQKEALIHPHEIMTLATGRFVGKLAAVKENEKEEPLYSAFFNVRPNIDRETIKHEFPQLLKVPNSNRDLTKEEADELMLKNFKNIRIDSAQLVDRCARTACIMGKADETKVFPAHFQGGTRVVSTLAEPLYEGVKVDPQTGAVTGKADTSRPLGNVEAA